MITEGTVNYWGDDSVGDGWLSGWGGDDSGDRLNIEELSAEGWPRPK